jgi:hypothetical protein
VLALRVALMWISSYRSTRRNAEQAVGVAQEFAGITTRAALNINQQVYFGNNYNWLDVLKHGTEWIFGGGGSPTITADGWFTGLPTGGTARSWLFLDTDNAHGHFPPGQYAIKGGAGITKTVSAGPGITGITSSTTRAFFTVPDVTPHNSSDHSIQLLLTNSDGSVPDVTDADPVVVVRVSDEAALDSGYLWSTLKKSQLGNVAITRLMDIAGVNLAGDQDHYDYPLPGSTLPTAATRTWTQTPTGCPYDVQARLAVETGKIAWMCLRHPTQGLMFSCDSGTDRITPRRGGPGGVWPAFDPGWVEGDRVTFYVAGWFAGSGITAGTPYYVRNPSGGTFQLSTTAGGSILNITSTLSPATGSYGRLTKWWSESEVIAWYASIAAQIRAVYPANRKLLIELTNEPWNFGFLNGEFARDVFAVMAGSSDDRGIGQAYGSLLMMRGFLQHFRLDELTLVGAFQTDFYDIMSSSLSYVDPGHVVAGWTFGRILEAFGYYAFNPYITPVNPDTDEGYTTAELIAANAQDWTDATWASRFTPAITASAAAVSGHIASVRATYAMMRITGGETGHHLFTPASNPHTPQEAAVQARFTSFLSGAEAAAVYESLYQLVHVANELLAFTQYIDAGGVAGRQYIWHWGLRSTSGSPDNARTQWLASKPGLPNNLGAEIATAVRAMISGDATTPDNALADGLVVPSGWGKTFDYQRQNIAGSAIADRVGTSPDWDGFFTGTNKSGSNLNLLAEWSNPTTVSGGDYTHLYITERHALLDALRNEDAVRNLMVYVEAFTSRSPGAKPVLWYGWHPGWNNGSSTYKPLTSVALVNDFIRYERQTVRLWESVRQRINLTAINKGYTWRLDGCPMNLVLATVLDRACNGTLAGITGGSVTATVAVLSSDGGVTLNTAVGRYLTHLVFFAHVYRRSPIAAAYPAGVTATQAASLQSCVYDALLDYINWNEKLPAMAQARTNATGAADDAFDAHFGYSADGTWVGTNSNGRPFYFDSASDTASYGWFTPPASDSGPGTPVGGLTANTFYLTNSLYYHAYPEGSTATHFKRLADQAPGGGNVFTHTFMFGFPAVFDDPPLRSPHPDVPTPFVPNYTSGPSWDGLSNYEWVAFTPDNFEGPNYPPDEINGFGFAYTSRILIMIDEWEANAPNVNRKYVIHGGWYFMNYPQDPWDFDAARKLDWIGRTLGDYQDWLEEMHAIIAAARPALDIRLHRINYATTLALRDTAINTIPWIDLWEDNAPHGKQTMFFLTAIATYIEIYNEKPPTGFVFDGAWGMNSVLTSNYQAIVDYMWSVLRP